MSILRTSSPINREVMRKKKVKGLSCMDDDDAAAVDPL